MSFPWFLRKQRRLALTAPFTTLKERRPNAPQGPKPLTAYPHPWTQGGIAPHGIQTRTCPCLAKTIQAKKSCPESWLSARFLFFLTVGFPRRWVDGVSDVAAPRLFRWGNRIIAKPASASWLARAFGGNALILLIIFLQLIDFVFCGIHKGQ